jgi:2,5-diamino-6-(ribosylamino)-4(3H)-pyrimidinone 5'-phosphate reductase
MDRPFVLVNMASTLDGKITSAAREYPRFTTRNDRLRMDRLRAQADAIVVGGGTLRADDPLLHVRDPEMQRYRDTLGKGGLVKVVVTASARIDPSSRFFEESDGGARIVATVDDAPAERLAPLAPRAEIWRLGRGRVDVRELCRRLRERGVERLLLEGGGELNWDFVRDDLVDEIHVTIAPALLGGRDAPTLLEGAGFTMAAQRRLRLVELEREDDELFGHWAVIR